METRIELSKSKIVLMFLGALAFVAASIWFLTNPEKFAKVFFNLDFAVYTIAILGISFFGLIAVLLFKKIFNSKPGILINSAGITDNSSALSAGFIPWEDISAIESKRITNQKFIIIILKNPENYLEKIQNKFKQRAMQMNYKMSNSPINISANSLKISFDDLYEVLNKALSENSKTV